MDRQRTDKELEALADLFLTNEDVPEQTSLTPEGTAIAAHRQNAQKRRVAPGTPAPPSPGSVPSEKVAYSCSEIAQQVNASANSSIVDASHLPRVEPQPAYSTTTRSTGLMTEPQPARLTPKMPPRGDSDLAAHNQMDHPTTPTVRDEPTLRLVNHELEAIIQSQSSPVSLNAQQPARIGPTASMPASESMDSTDQDSVLQTDGNCVIEDKRVEVVFLGNLPGFASPWMTQYAQHVALECGVVGVLHIDDEQIDLDFVTTPGNRNKLDQVHKQIMNFEKADDLIAVMDLLNQGADQAIGA